MTSSGTNEFANTDTGNVNVTIAGNDHSEIEFKDGIGEIEMIRKPTPYELQNMNTVTAGERAVALVHLVDGRCQRYENVRKVAHVGRSWIMINFHSTTGREGDHGKRITIPYDYISESGIESTSDVRVSFSEPALE